MLQILKTSRIAPYLFFGFTVFICLMIIGWSITSDHVAEQMRINELSHTAADKQHTLSKLIEIARKRTRLSHEMLLSDDVFEKDAMAIQIASLASDFIINRRELLSQELTEQQTAIIESQKYIYPDIIANLETVADLALQDTTETTEQARDLIFREIVPRQRIVIDGFTQIMRSIEEDVHTASQELIERNKAFQKTSLLLLISILTVSAATITVVFMKSMHIEDKLLQLSTTDELTGISNRRFFNDNLQRAWKNASRSLKPIAVLIIDIDYFKHYNDRYGHQKGDECLFKVAKIIQSEVHRSGDIVARYGGEEFAVAIPNADESGAKVVAERLLKKLQLEAIPHETSETEQYVSISIGYASMVPTRDNASESLIKAADDALYESKRTGRNKATCAVYDVPSITTIPMQA